MAGHIRVLGTLAAVGALALSGGSAIAAGSGMSKATAYTCVGGAIPSGTYASITVTGPAPCSVAEDAVVNVVGNITVAAGAFFDAQSVPSTITVGHNVTGAADSLVGLGCQPPSLTGNSAHPCVDANDHPTEGASDITVNGNITITDAALVALNGITVHGNVTLSGGGDPNPFGIPSFWTVKNSTVDRNVTVHGQSLEWIGVMFNEVGRNVTLTNIVVDDEHENAPGVFVVRNTVERNLTCTGLTPGVFGYANDVGRNMIGQCADLV